MSFSAGQNVFLIHGIRIPQNIFFLFLIESILILLSLTLGWKIALLLSVLSVTLLICLLSDLGFIYFIIIISPLVYVFGIPYETMRLLKWVIVSMIIFVGLGKILLLNRPFLIPKTKLVKFILLFIVLAAVTTLFSANFGKSLLELLRVSSFFVLFFLVFNTIESRRDIKMVIGMWIIVAVIISFYGIWQYFVEGVGRIYSTFENSNSLGQFCFMTVTLILSLVIYENRKSLRILYSLIFFVLMITLFLAGSRASWLSTLAAIITISFATKNKKLFLFTLTSLIIVFCAVIVSPMFKNIFENIIRLSTGLSYRPLLWESALNLIKDNLFFGVGLNATGEVLPHYSVTKTPVLHLYLYQFFKTGNVHNFYLQLVAETGILGLFLFLYFFKVCLAELKTSLNKEKDAYPRALFTAGFALIVATFVHAFFEMSHIIGAGSYSVFFWIFLALLYSFDKIKMKSRFRKKTRNHPNGI